MRMTRSHLAASLLAAAISFSASAPVAAASPRVVSVGGSTTEIIYALGAEGALVGVDSTSLYPAAATEHPDIGYVRQLSPEGLLSLRPDIIIAGQEAGPRTALEQAEAAGVKVISLSQGNSPETVASHISEVGAALHHEKEAALLRDQFEKDMETVRAGLAGVTEKPRVLFLLQRGRGAGMVSGTGTAADAMITLAGGINAVSEYSGYKPFSAEAVSLAAPDVILTTDHAVGASGGESNILSDPAFAMTPAGQNGRLVAMEALYFSGFGPRLAHAVQDLAIALHPALDLKPLPQRPWTKPIEKTTSTVETAKKK